MDELLLVAPETHGLAGGMVPSARLRRAWLVIVGCMLGCSSYDAGLLQPTRTRSASVRTELPVQCTGADGSCSSCGDGKIDPGETCDPPESCLSAEACASPNHCVIAHFSGDPEKCTARCELQPLTACKSGDGCCPSQCRNAIDDDCSASCGDGIVDPVAETCEPDSREHPCVKSCDDGDACTEDRTIGSLDNCNLDCTHVSVTATIDGDGCCPPGANSGTDSDCSPTCGNGVLEPGEECDGGEECSGSCKRVVGGECEQALAEVTGISDACKACACSRCSSRVLACYMTNDRERNAACGTIAACTRRTGCSNGTCYCGASIGCTVPAGACKDEIESAAGTKNPSAVLLCGNNPTCPVTRAYAQDLCLRQSCSAECASPAMQTWVQPWVR